MKLFLVIFLLISSCVSSTGWQAPSVAKSYIDGNIPIAKNFHAFLIRDLRAYLQPELGRNITVNYELLRKIPTQAGVADPKFYLWVTVFKQNKLIREGAVRVAAIDRTGFEVTHFIDRHQIVTKPDILANIFPALLIPKILIKAGVKQ
jgi:hypothetical protein